MATPPDQLPLLVAALADHDVALGSRIQPDGSRHARDPAGLPPAARAGLPPPRVGLGRGPGPGHPMRVQGVHAGRRPRPVRAAADHEHRVRRRAHLPRSTPRLPPGDRADPLVRPARLADARSTGPRAPRRAGTCSGSRSSIAPTAGALAGRRDRDARRAPAGPDGAAGRRDRRLRGRGRGDRRGRRRHARLRLPGLSPGRGPPPRWSAGLRPRVRGEWGVRALLLPTDVRADHRAVRPALGDDGRLGLDRRC